MFDLTELGKRRYIQIFTAICDSFAHGANDVANAMGPFMAIYAIYNDGGVSKKVLISYRSLSRVNILREYVYFAVCHEVTFRASEKVGIRSASAAYLRVHRCQYQYQNKYQYQRVPD